MSETSNPSPAQSQPPQELHWGISYLREDIQDLRQDMHQAVQGVRQELREDIQDLRQDMHQAVQGVRQELRESAQGIHQMVQGVRQELREDIQDLRHEIRGTHGRIDEANRSLNERIDGVAHSLGTRIDEKYDLLNRAMRSQFTWLMTTMIALAGIIVAAIKL
jgi:uncharacterized coiled-coil DUF342 family protein